MLINKLYEYVSLERVTHPDGTRFYTDPTDGTPLPSVTTILSGTACKQGLKEWEEYVGKAKADKVRLEATNLGTLMHTNVENHILGVPRPGGNHMLRRLAHRMADQIINKGLCHVDEVWGQEVGMYFPGLYAGTTDLVGIHKGVPAIMDHKSAKKMRSLDMVQDYFDQMAAYALAHDEVYGTKIRKGVIFMCARDLEFKEFIVEGLEFDRHMESFLSRTDTYFSQKAAA